MCTTCGCGGDGATIDGKAHAHAHDHAHDHEHAHTHARPGVRRRVVAVEQDLLAKNNALAADNRAWFQARGVFALNLVSSPGSGKTTLLVETIRRLQGKVGLAVIEGDQQTSHDADRIRAAGAPAVQINTGKGCHLDAHMVGHAAADLGVAEDSVLLIENVGNLVCPAGFDLGEAHKVVILSVTEGEDKPFKYPDMFAAADVMVVNKIDLLPHLVFDVEACVANALRVNPGLHVIRLSATTGENLEAWTRWILAGHQTARGARQEQVPDRV